LFRTGGRGVGVSCKALSHDESGKAWRGVRRPSRNTWLGYTAGGYWGSDLEKALQASFPIVSAPPHATSL
jgi:hypothetical protein